MSINITEIKTKDCVPFDANPFAVRDNGEMELLKESIRQNGVLHPITVDRQGTAGTRSSADTAGYTPPVRSVLKRSLRSLRR